MSFSLRLMGIAAALCLSACGKHEAPVPPAMNQATPAGPQAVSDYVAAAEPTPGGNCALDAVNGTTVVNAAATASQGDVTFGGWMSNAEGQVPTDALLVFQGPEKSYSTAAVGGGDRPDVAAALGKDGLRTSGYNTTVTLSGVVPGSYALSIVYGGATPVSCALNVTLDITG